jgi:uncharacterized protein YuzE
MVSVTFDPEVKALYVRVLENARIAQTIPLGQGKYVDVTETGELVGLEIIFASSTPQEALDAIINSKQLVELKV